MGGEWREDKNAYLFILTDQGELVKFSLKKGGEKYAVIDFNNNWLTCFGGGGDGYDDLAISNNCNKNTDSFSELNRSY